MAPRAHKTLTLQECIEKANLAISDGKFGNEEDRKLLVDAYSEAMDLGYWIPPFTRQLNKFLFNSGSEYRVIERDVWVRQQGDHEYWFHCKLELRSESEGMPLLGEQEFGFVKHDLAVQFRRLRG